jgi:ribosomal protein S17
LSELLLEKWIKHVIIEGEEETKGEKNIVYGEVSEEQERTIVGKVNTLWNKYIYNNVKKENSKYNISLLQLYDTKIIETQL